MRPCREQVGAFRDARPVSGTLQSSKFTKGRGCHIRAHATRISLTFPVAEKGAPPVKRAS